MREFLLGEGGFMGLEQCPSCCGLFFDSGELEALMANSDAAELAVHRERIWRLASELSPVSHRDDQPANCPVCRKQMEETRYAGHAVVTIDVCAQHGIWLDGGELYLLLQEGRRLQQKANSPGPDDEADVASLYSSRARGASEKDCSSGLFLVVEGLLSLLLDW